MKKLLIVFLAATFLLSSVYAQSVSYDFDKIEVFYSTTFTMKPVSVNPDNWLVKIAGGVDKPVTVVYGIFNLNKGGNVLVQYEEYIKFNGEGGSERFLVTSNSGSFEQKELTSFFWSAKKLTADSLVKDFTEPVLSAALVRNFDSNRKYTSISLTASNDGLKALKKVTGPAFAGDVMPGTIEQSTYEADLSSLVQWGSIDPTIDRPCVETDKGIDYFEKGATEVTPTGPVLQEDFCQKGGDISNPSKDYSAASCSGDDCNLIEYYCYGGSSNFIAIPAKNGCNNGAIQLACDDTDNSPDYSKASSIPIAGQLPTSTDVYVKGTATDLSLGHGASVDRCVNRYTGQYLSSCQESETVRCVLEEGYCGSNGRGTTDIECPAGCQDGACIEGAAPPKSAITCSSDAEINSQIQSCKSQGMDYKLGTDDNGCQKVACTSKISTEQPVAPVQVQKSCKIESGGSTATIKVGETKEVNNLQITLNGVSDDANSCNFGINGQVSGWVNKGEIGFYDITVLDIIIT